MKGRIPKATSLRQRRNKTIGANLPAEGAERRRRVPPLPEERGWHKLTLAWWREIWHSPMAGEYLRADVHGLYRLAVLVDQFWQMPTSPLAAEIRLQQTCFGLTPLDRRRLQWEVERVEGAKRRKQPTGAPKMDGTGDDPREMLRLLK